jgi:thimet oligopeptidase
MARKYARLFICMVALLACATLARAERAAHHADVEKWLAWGDAQVRKIIEVPDDQRTFENTLGALDDISARITTECLHNVVLAYLSPDAADRESGHAVEAALNEWAVNLSLNEDLYKAVKAYADTKPNLEGERARLLYFTMRDYRRAGMDLPPEQREELKQIQLELSDLSIEFNKNAQTDETTVLLTRKELDGMPASFFDTQFETNGLYVIGMDGPTTVQIWTRCPNETTRKKVWFAYKREGGQRNVTVLEKILKLRARAAQLLGYRHYADYSTEVLMTKNAATVDRFYDELRPLVREKSNRDYAELRDRKREHLNDPDAELYAWDYWYYADLLKNEKYAVDSQRIQEYFPLQPVMDGMFNVFTTLFEVRFVDETQDAKDEGLYFWADDMLFYRVYDNSTGDFLGEVFLDLHPRPNKRGGAFQWTFIPRKRYMDGTYQHPRAVVQCNFPRPTADKPSLLTHDDVTTLFHEFGHFIHSVLGENELQGCEDVEQDFVELPSQIYENWCWDADVLRTFAKHYKTGEPLPQELLDGMLAARQFASGMLAERQFYYGMVDQAYNRLQVGQDIDVTEIGLRLQDEVEQYPGIEGTYFQSGFTHLTNYIASYYGYQWALVYTYDCFGKFEEMGLLNPEAGMHYRRTILAPAGTVDASVMLRNFLGREPKMDAYIRALGLDDRTARVDR